MMRSALVLVSLLFLAAFAWGGNSPVNFGGVGIDGVPRADGTIVVRQLVAGGPAHLAGVKTGDLIVQIDGTPTAGSSFQEMVEHRLRGRAGTPVTLKVRRAGNAKPLTFKLVRRQLALAGARKREPSKGE